MEQRPIKISSVCLPRDSALKRELQGPLSREESAKYESGQMGEYDARTIFYDVFLGADRKTVTAIGPPLVNLERVLMPARLSIGSNALSLRVTAGYKKIAVLSASLPAALPIGGDLSAELVFANGFKQPIQVSESLSLQGRSLVTLQKNNRLRWIRDWARYYKEEFGVSNIFIYDNASDNQEELMEKLQGEATVLLWNFPHGPRGLGFKNKYCQVGALNHFKLRFAGNSTIFNFDIDELLIATNERAREEILSGKLLRFDNFFVPFALDEKRDDFSFADFRLRETQARNKARKYTVPGPMPGLMNVHYFIRDLSWWQKMSPEKVRYGKVMPIRDAYFLHYKGITTHWKMTGPQNVAKHSHGTIQDDHVSSVFSKLDARLNG